MAAGIGAFLRRAAGDRSGTGGDEELERLRRASLTLFVMLVIAVTPVWVGTYLWLARPLSAAIPAGYALLSVVGLALLATTGRFAAFRATQIGAILVLPVLLQWSLGGFVNGSAVALWAFAAPIGGLLFYGPRRGIALFVAFGALIALSGLLDPLLAASVAPMPPAVVTAFFILNAIAPVAAAFGLLLYFNRQRERAIASSERLLLSILPCPIAVRLKAGERTIADRHSDVSILFADIVGFTPFSERTPPEQVVGLLNRAFTAFDALVVRLGLEKIVTIGDAYLVAGGLPDPRPDHLEAVAELALAMRPELERAVGDEWPEARLRIGIAVGPVVAGVIGDWKFGYDVWGDTVNTASRMQEHGLPGAIQVTGAVADRLRERYQLEPRGEVELKASDRCAPGC